MLDDLGAAVACALYDAIKGGLVHQFSNWNTRDGGVAGKRDHGVAVSAEDEGVDVLDADFEFLRDEGAEAGGVEDSGHADHAFARESADFVGGLRHGVERVRHDDQDAVRRAVYDFADHVAHDFVVGVEKVVAAHAGLAGDSGSDDDDVGVGRVGVVVGAEDGGVALLDGHGFEQVETFALGDPFHDVDEDDIGEFFRGDPMGGGGAYVSGTYDGDFIAHMKSFPTERSKPLTHRVHGGTCGRP